MIFLSKKIGKAISVLTAAALMICLSQTSVYAEGLEACGSVAVQQEAEAPEAVKQEAEAPEAVQQEAEVPEAVQQEAEAPEAVQQMAEAPEDKQSDEGQSGEGQLEEEGYGEAKLHEEDAQAASNNLHYHTYFGSWIDRPYSFLYEQGGEYVRVEYISGDADSRDEYQGTIHIEHYTKDLEFKSGMSLPLELPVFGGFYKGKDALYLAEGKKNPNDDPNQEVIRVIKYDFSWNRLGAVSYYGIDTSDPFACSNVSMAEYGDYLYIHTGRIKFDSGDGLKHQENTVFCIDKNRMVSKDHDSNFDYRGDFLFASHCFNQYVVTDGDDVVVVAHTDSRPEGILLGVSDKMASDGYVCPGNIPDEYSDSKNYWGFDPYTDVKEAQIFKITGESGYNYTGCTTGGLECSSSNYLTAMSHVTINDSYKSNNDWNISVLVTPKNALKSSMYNDERGELTVEKKITTDAGGGLMYENPYIIKINDDLFVMMWEINRDYNFTGQYQAVAINGNGDKISPIITCVGELSDCKPIYTDGKLLWYTTGGGRYWTKMIYDSSKGDFTFRETANHGRSTTPVFYSLSVSSQNGTCVLTPGGGNNQGTIDFVSRLYTIILGRAAESAGLNDWTMKLVNKEQTGAQVASGFILSREFEEQGNSDSAYVKKLYRAFFDRQPDVAGYNMWMSRLATGADRRTVLAGFTNSQEFADLCARFGIERESLDFEGLPGGDDSKAGSFLLIDSSGVDEGKLNEYVERLYTKILGRSGEADGMDYWRREILSGNRYDAASVARVGFFTSKEYLEKNKTNQEFITDAYHAFFNRDPDEAGYNYWIEQLSSGGYDRDSMIEVGFGHSAEFKNLLTGYGFRITD